MISIRKNNELSINYAKEKNLSKSIHIFVEKKRNLFWISNLISKQTSLAYLFWNLNMKDGLHVLNRELKRTNTSERMRRKFKEDLLLLLESEPIRYMCVKDTHMVAVHRQHTCEHTDMRKREHAQIKCTVPLCQLISKRQTNCRVKKTATEEKKEIKERRKKQENNESDEKSHNASKLQCEKLFNKWVWNKSLFAQN